MKAKENRIIVKLFIGYKIEKQIEQNNFDICKWQRRNEGNNEKDNIVW